VFPGLEDPNTPPPAQTSSGIVDIGAFPGLEGSQGIQASVGMDAPPPTQASIGLGDVSSTLTFPGLGLAPLQESNPAEFGNPPPSQESLGLAPPSSDAFPGLGDSPPPNQESLGLAPPSSVASPAPNGPPPSSDSLGLVPPSTAASPPLDDAFPGLSGPPPSSETLGLASPSAASPPALGFPPQESLGLVPPPSATSPPSLSGPPSQAPPELSDPTFGTAPPGQGSPPLEDGSGLVDPEFGVAPPELGVPAQGAQPPEEEETPEVPETSDAPEVPESPESEAAELGLPPLDPSDFLPGPANITSTSSNTTSSPLDGCYPYTLLFARGTSETGLLGGSVGPLLKSSLGPEWYVEGVAYEANTEGIECLGMPGGVQCVKQIDELVERCPETTVVLGGYSQGAMVARVCAAFAGDDAKENIGVRKPIPVFLLELKSLFALVLTSCARVLRFSATHLMVLVLRVSASRISGPGVIPMTQSAVARRSSVLHIWHMRSLGIQASHRRCSGLENWLGMRRIERKELALFLLQTTFACSLICVAFLS
jgi:hypothetical protein